MLEKETVSLEPECRKGYRQLKEFIGKGKITLISPLIQNPNGSGMRKGGGTSSHDVLLLARHGWWVYKIECTYPDNFSWVSGKRQCVLWTGRQAASLPTGQIERTVLWGNRVMLHSGILTKLSKVHGCPAEGI